MTKKNKNKCRLLSQSRLTQKQWLGYWSLSEVSRHWVVAPPEALTGCATQIYPLVCDPILWGHHRNLKNRPSYHRILLTCAASPTSVRVLLLLEKPGGDMKGAFSASLSPQWWIWGVFGALKGRDGCANLREVLSPRWSLPVHFLDRGGWCIVQKCNMTFTQCSRQTGEDQHSNRALCFL